MRQVALFFEEAFWPHTTDFFGRTAASKSERGSFFLFFNVHACTGRPVILALLAGTAAQQRAPRALHPVRRHRPSGSKGAGRSH